MHPTAPATPATPATTRSAPTGPRSLAAAVELQVDEEDVQLRSPAERELWKALQEEFQAFVARFGPVWIADG